MRKGAGRDLVRRLTPCHTTGSVSRTANTEHIQQHVQQHVQQQVGSRP
jgi:hypothetical protein